MLSKKTKKAIALSMALTISGGFAQSNSVVTAAYGEEINGQEAGETLEAIFIKADESLTEKLESELNNETLKEDVQAILDDFEYVTSGAAVRITAKNITEYKNDDEEFSFKASLEGYEKNGDSYEVKDVKEFTYSKPKKTSIFTTMAYSSLQGNGEWKTSNSLTNVGERVTITNGNQIVEFKLLNAENKTVCVSENGMTGNGSIAVGSVELDIPETITCNNVTYTVTEIEQYAFKDCDKLAKVTIPDSVEILWIGPFYNCSKIKSLTLPEEINTIGDYAFY